MVSHIYNNSFSQSISISFVRERPQLALPFYFLFIFFFLNFVFYSLKLMCSFVGVHCTDIQKSPIFSNGTERLEIVSNLTILIAMTTYQYLPVVLLLCVTVYDRYGRQVETENSIANA